MYWLHFIGKKNYTISSFQKEAKKFGVTRRVSLKILQKMRYRDVVLLAILDGKSSVIFGGFKITKLSGLSASAAEAILSAFDHVEVDRGGELVTRGCGSYTTGPAYEVDATLKEEVEVLKACKDRGIDIASPMVGGPYYRILELLFFETPKLIRLKDVPFQRGFREFNENELMERLGEVEIAKNGVKAVKGQFYVFGASEKSVERKAGIIQEGKDYQRGR